jgi:hypothetical protein
MERSHHYFQFVMHPDPWLVGEVYGVSQKCELRESGDEGVQMISNYQVDISPED